MLTEKEYRISKFEERFKKYKNKNIVLYGTGANTKAILEKFTDYNIIGLMDPDKYGSYYYGKRVLSSNEVLEMQVDIIIIAAQIKSAQVVYKRICEFCMRNHILLLDMYGNIALEVNREVTEQMGSFLNLNDEKVKSKIDEADYVSFNVLDTLLMYKELSSAEVYELIENEAARQGIIIRKFRDVRWNAQDRLERVSPSRVNLGEIYSEIVSSEKLAPEKKDILIEIEKSVRKRQLIPRREMIELFRYAVKNEKRVYLIYEDVLDRKTLEEVLAEFHIVDYKGIVIESECGVNKYNGLFRSLLLSGGNGKYLHIGTDPEKDGIIPQMYGMKVCLIKSAFELMQEATEYRLTREQIDYGANRFFVGEFVSNYFSNPFVMYHNYSRKLPIKTQDIIRITEVKAVGRDDVKITYRPILVNSTWNAQSGIEPEKLVFAEQKKPVVTIIIPVYNQIEFTYNCLQSILLHTQDISYEVIIADDCSTDLTKDLEKYVQGITVIHNKQNLRFLLNCNNAAKKAKGKYILFLNNDTQVQPSWLSSLVDLMEQDEKIGLAGSKLVYPSGRLQEAGGIVWKDGSAWNFGNRKDPDDAIYNYVKEVDYISGAAIMIRTSLWKELGGFDKRFAPAYYEDTDLAFEVRAHGYKVVYQPLSVVVHFEGVSNGTDTSSGEKANQVKNQEKFLEKWGNILATEHFNNAENVYIAKDRSKNQKHILVVDHYVPNYDKDAGGKCTYMYLKTFLKMGMHVTFIGDNFAKLEPYTTELTQLGIEILYGDYYYLNWKDWLIANLQYFDFVYLQRPHISIKYIDLVKQYGRAKIFYFAHDLHHLREYRQYLIDKNPETLESSKKWKKIEYELFEKADVGHVVGSYEQSIMQKAFPEKPIRNIPLYIYEDECDDIEKDFSLREDIMYVGGFGHPPNIDAVMWFAKEVFPRVLEKYPEMKWHVIGGRVPEGIQNLANDNILIEGFQPDEVLHKLYHECRMAVVPLRYGAGVKGKVVESAYFQIPLVTTSIGAEGLDCSDETFVVEDDPDRMAEKICELYEDYDALRRMSDKGKKFIEKYFTLQVAEDVLKADMNV